MTSSTSGFVERLVAELGADMVTPGADLGTRRADLARPLPSRPARHVTGVAGRACVRLVTGPALIGRIATAHRLAWGRARDLSGLASQQDRESNEKGAR